MSGAKILTNPHCAQTSSEDGIVFSASADPPGARGTATGIVDTRLVAIERWLDTQPGLQRAPGETAAAYSLSPASADASFRRYFRARYADGQSSIVMDAPPDKEDCRPFVHVAALLRKAGLHAPEILAQDLDQGFLLLSDLGTQTYLDVLTGPSATEAHTASLFADATEALVRWQLASRENDLPPYDDALLRREMNLFPEWYVGRHLGRTLTTAQRDALETVFAQLVASALAQPRVYVHRDFMPRNLMVSTPNPGILDFQDAVYGPITYDAVSLWRDAFISWDEERVLDGCARYWSRARQASLPVHPDFAEFYRQFEWMGLQRHLKVLGIFARLTHRDGKEKYVADSPRFVRYARAVAERYSALAPLARLLDELEGAVPKRTGLTF